MEVSFPGPENPQPPYGRNGHPYFMHDMVRSQPSAVRSTITATERVVSEIPRPPQDRTVLFVGLGTSFHAARAGAWAAGPAWEYRQPIRAVDSFELLLEPEQIQHAGAAIVYSSSGETALTLRAQEAIREAGVPQILVTGTSKSSSVDRADHVLPTRESDEKAWVHTVSYTTAIAATLTLLHRWSGQDSVNPTGVDRAIEDVVRREDDWRGLAKSLEDRQKFLVLGSGPAEATAREAALKLREGAGRFVASTGVEEFLHGTLPSIDKDGSAVIAVTCSALDGRRAGSALHAAADAGAKVALFRRGRPSRTHENEFELPKVAPALTPLVDIVPLQFLVYWLSVAAGRNPDVMGYDDPRIFAARRTYGI